MKSSFLELSELQAVKNKKVIIEKSFKSVAKKKFNFISFGYLNWRELLREKLDLCEEF